MRAIVRALLVSITLLVLPTFLPVAYPQEIEIKLVSLTSPANAGSNATIVVNTATNANCHITVLYKSGPSKAQGLFPKSTDDQGSVSWTWKVGSRTTPGNWPITVICSSGKQQGTLRTSFIVR